ncbi:hypothetical protein [Campylobacter concisus]|uniref:Uncharacterized protein n=1 Tax=Campylobacter concisus (strain 13826) TaxID=360104 RepID=A7ZF42_CAMC1|nr:hypothetical protein [Campylobacter concisus]EAT99376.1 hypothetical protein CCC13826_0567 [Campylobacter concisus 13826]
MKDKKLIIKDIQGEIYVISQDGSIKMLKDGDEIYAGEKIFTKNLDAKITLEDGEQVNLSAHQSINLDEILKISAKEAQEQSDHSNGFGASEGISLSAASFVTSGHSANIHQIYNQHRSLEPNVSSTQLAQLKSASGASSTLVEKSGGAAEPKEEPFIDTINVLSVTNRGLDADIWLYDSARNDGRGLDYYDIEHNSKSILKEWSASHHVSATSTFNDLYYYSGQQADPGYFDASDSAKASRLRDRTPTAMELAKIGRASNADYANDRLSENMTSPFKPHNLNGHYKLYDSKITADGVMVSMDGWIFIKNRSDINNFYYDAKPERQSIKFEFDGREISWQPFGSASKNGGRDEGNAPQGVSTSSLNLTEDYGFYKVHIEVSDDRYSYNFTAFSGISPTNKIISDDPNIKLVSNAYMEALAQKGLVTKESDTFYKAKETNGVKFGDNASDFDKPFDLEFKGTKDVGSNYDDEFIFNSHDIDAKGGKDTLLFTQNVDLTKIEDLDKRLESFERIELDHTKAVKLKLNGQNIIDMIDSNPTKGPDGLESLNTILKISGDSDDVVQLVGNFIKATSAEVAALNAKHSVIGADYNKLTVEPSGDAVNQVYKGENNAGQTFFVEIDKNVHVEVM